LRFAVRFTAAAERDVAEAFSYYEGKRKGLGVEFIERVDEAVDVVAQNPKLHAPVIEAGRRVLLRQFPFAIWYVLAEDGSVVIGCIHSKRHERLAASRIRSIKPKGPSPA
jgi:plasmid stabilization system protein ParE